jgi:hypothetical protein
MIEITFPVPVEFPEGFFQVLDRLVNMVCEKYEAENPTRTMWPCGHGSKPIWREPEEPLFDESVYQISVSERKAHPKELERRGIVITKGMES